MGAEPALRRSLEQPLSRINEREKNQYIPEVPPSTPNVLFGTLSRPSLIDNISIGYASG